MQTRTVRATADWTGLPTGSLTTGWSSGGSTYGSTDIGSATSQTGNAQTGKTVVSHSTAEGTATRFSSSATYTESGGVTYSVSGVPGQTDTYTATRSESYTSMSEQGDTYAASSASSRHETQGETNNRTYYTDAQTIPGGPPIWEVTYDPGATAGTAFGVSYPTTASRTVRTFSGTSHSTSQTTRTYDQPTQTLATSAPVWFQTTTGETVGTGTATTVTWDFTDTSSDRPTTDTSVNYDSTAAITGTEREFYTLTGSFLQTSHANSPLQDTVILMEAGFDAGDSNLGYALWSYSHSAPVWSISSTGVFTGFYASTDAATLTLSDLRVFSSSTWALPVITAVQLSNTAEIVRTQLNGHEITGTATSAGHTQTFAMGAVGESVTGTTTLFTHSVYLSGYSNGTSFTTGTSVGYWSATSTSGTHLKWDSTAATTVAKSSRLTTSYATTFSSFTATGTGTGVSFLGRVSTALSTVLVSQVTLTSSTYRSGDGCDIFTYSSPPRTDDIDQVTVIHESAARVAITSARLALSTAVRQPLHAVGDHLWYTVPAHGLIGFGGSFTQPGQTVYLTTSQGLAAGDTFTTASLLPPTATKEWQEGRDVTFYPVDAANPPQLLGVGLAASSLLSPPTSLVTALSVAATWTSTTLTGTDTSTVSRSATHTLAVITPITGNFVAGESPVYNSGDNNIGLNGPHASAGGWAAGDNRHAADATVRMPHGRVSWTAYSASDSTGGASSSSENSAATISFILPAAVAIRFQVEDIIEARWVTNAPSTPHHFLATEKHISHS